MPNGCAWAWRRIRHDAYGDHAQYALQYALLYMHMHMNVDISTADSADCQEWLVILSSFHTNPETWASRLKAIAQAMIGLSMLALHMWHMTRRTDRSHLQGYHTLGKVHRSSACVLQGQSKQFARQVAPRATTRGVANPLPATRITYVAYVVPLIRSCQCPIGYGSVNSDLLYFTLHTNTPTQRQHPRWPQPHSHTHTQELRGAARLAAFVLVTHTQE